MEHLALLIREKTSQAAFRKIYDDSLGSFTEQFSPPTDVDVNFSFQNSHGLNGVGDKFWGRAPNIEKPLGDANWIYEWMDEGKVNAQTQDGSPINRHFKGINCYPTGNLVINIIADGDFAFVITSDIGTYTYSGNLLAGNNFDITTGGDYLRGQFDNVQSSFRNPVGIGRALNGDFLNTDSIILQHRLSQYSTLQSAINNGDGIIYDAIGHGMRTETILGSGIESSFNALPDTNDIAHTLTYHKDGSVFGIGSTSLADTGHVAKKPLIGTISQISLIVDTQFPTTAINNIGQNTLFVATGGAVTPSQILRSIDAGVTWQQVVSTAVFTYVTGMTRFRDGTIVGVRYTSFTVGSDPTPIYSKDNGDTWPVASAVPGCNNGTMTYGNHFFQFMEHSDGTVFYCGRGTLTEQYIKIWSASDIDGAFTEIGEVGPNLLASETVGCCYIDPLTDAIYVGMQEAVSNDVMIRKSVDKGITFTTVYLDAGATNQMAPVRIISTPQGYLYALVRTNTNSSDILRSVDGGDSWTVIESYGSALKDIIYNPNDSSVYTIRNNGAGGQGYLIETIAVEKDIATLDNTDPIKMRMYQGNFDVFNAVEKYDEGETIKFGQPNLRVNREFFGLLQNPLAPILHTQAPIGCLFRNSADQDRLWVKDVNGDVYPVNGIFDPVLLTAGFMTPDPANTGAFGTTEIGAGSSRTNFDVLDFGDTGTDYYYAQIAPPKNWYSAKLQFRVSYLVRDAISAPAVFSWVLGAKKISKNSGVAASYQGQSVTQTLPDTTVDLWRKTDWSDALELPFGFEPGEDSLSLRVNRDNGVTNNEDGSALFSEIEIRWLP